MRELNSIESKTVAGSGLAAAVLTAPITAAYGYSITVVAALSSPVVFYQSYYSKNEGLVQSTQNALHHSSKGVVMAYNFIKGMYNW